MYGTIAIISLASILATAAPFNGTSSPSSISPNDYKCFDFDIPLSFDAVSLQPGFEPFQNHYEAVSLLEKLTSRNRAEYPPPIIGARNVPVNVKIAAQYCAPAGGSNGVVQILTHGLGFDRSYWEFGGKDSSYNYIRAATQAGYATISYDRIGNGRSTKSDPYTINQLAIQTRILAILTRHVRARDLSALSKIDPPKRIVHVGHSYGSQLSVALVASHPSLSDGLILTGFATNSSAGLIISSNFHLAKEASPGRFRGLSSGYLTWGDELSNQYSFLHWPNFAPDVLARSERNKSPFAIGEILTSTATPTAANFSGPVLIVTGRYDQVFCQDDCSGGILDQTRVLLPRAHPFHTYIQPGTGHGMNLHFNSTGAYKVISDFLDSHIQK